MKPLSLPWVGAAASALVALSAAPAVHAQDMNGQYRAAPGVDASATVGNHGNYTLRQREQWLYSRLDQARDDGSIDNHELDRVHHQLSGIRDAEDRMRDAHDGHQLTDNETADLEARLDGVANQIHWMHDESFQKPW